MRQHFVIDSSVYINYGIYGKLYRIRYAVNMYALVLYVDNNLLAEIEKNLLLILKAPEKVNRMMEEIKDITISFTTIPIFINSPDPKDNFLFDLAIQTNSEVIVTQEKVLLDFAESPVAIHNIKWFKETFPVPL